MKQVKLTQGKFAIVDDDNFDMVNQFKWCAARSSSGTWYAIRSKSKINTQISMHRLIMGHKEGFIIDHKNRNGLFNTRENLRFCTFSENIINTKPKNGSKYKGVVIGYKSQKSAFIYKAVIIENKKSMLIGNFLNEIDAAKAYDKKAIEVHGEFACLNFPFDGTNY